MKKKLYFGFCVFFCVFFLSGIQADAHVTDHPELGDYCYYTPCVFSEGDLFVLKDTEKSFDAIYLVWNEFAESVEIRYNGITKEIFPEGIYHQFVDLEEETREVELRMRGSGMIEDIYGVKKEKDVSVYQKWQKASEADVLVVSTHADDEWLFLGGTIPLCVEEGKSVQVIYTVNHGINKDYFRIHEALDGLYKSGVRNQPLWSDLPDMDYAPDLTEAVKFYGKHGFDSFVADSIRMVKPDVIVSQDLNGEYGHGAHQLTVRAVKTAIRLAADPLYRFPQETHHVKKCYLHLYPKREIHLDYSRKLKAFGGRNVYDMIEDCFFCHTSQLKGWSLEMGDPAHYDNSRFGLYYSAVGNDMTRDTFFENLEKEAHDFMLAGCSKVLLILTLVMIIIGCIVLYFRKRRKKA